MILQHDSHLEGGYLYVASHMPDVHCECRHPDPLGFVRGAHVSRGIFWKALSPGEDDKLIGLIDDPTNERNLSMQSSYCLRHLIWTTKPIPPRMPPCYCVDRVPLPDPSRRIIIISALEGPLKLSWSGIKSDETSRFRSIWTIQPIDGFGLSLWRRSGWGKPHLN
jgi:hypothetical protein